MTFVDQLLKKYSVKVEKSTTHSLTNELCEGTLPDYKLYTYLVQDLKFFQFGLRLLGNALATCNKPESAVILGKQIGIFAHDENTYFHRCLEELRNDSGSELEQHVPRMLDQPPPTLKAVQEYLELLSYLTSESRSYEEIITFVYVMEKVYLGWTEFNLSKDAHKIQTLLYKHKEWVDLHSGNAFTEWVEFLAGEVDRLAISEGLKQKIDKFFEKTLDLEISFFDACYNYQGV